MAGNTSDKATLADFLAKIEAQYGKANRVWIMDRGIPAEETLAAKKEAGRAYGLVTLRLPETHQTVSPRTFSLALDRSKLRQIRWREGHYLLRSNLSGDNSAPLWLYSIQLTEIEQAVKELKGDLAIRPIYHQRDERIEAHIFVAFLAYCLQVT